MYTQGLFHVDAALFWCGALCSFTDPSFWLLLHFRLPPRSSSSSSSTDDSKYSSPPLCASVCPAVRQYRVANHPLLLLCVAASAPFSLPVCILNVHRVFSASCLLHLLSPSSLFSFFLFTSCFQLRWLQHGAFLIDLNEASTNKSFNLVAPPHFLSFFFSLTLYLSLTFSSLEVALCHISTVPCSSLCIA